MSALDALHNEYFDGIPVDSGTPNYAKGLKALARYIDQEVDHGPEAGWVGRLKEDIEAELQRLEERIEDSEHEIVDRPLQDLRSRDEALADRLDGLQEQVRENESRLSDLERTVDDVGATADRAEEKVDDTDELVDHVLEVLDEEDLLHYVPTAEVAEQAEPAEKLSAFELSSLIEDVFGDDLRKLSTRTASNPHGPHVYMRLWRDGEKHDMDVYPDLSVESKFEDAADWVVRKTQAELRAEYFRGELEQGGEVYESLDQLERETEQEHFLQVRGNGTTWAQLRRSLDDEHILVAEFKAHKAKRRFKSLLQQRGVIFSTMFHVAGPNGIAFHQEDLATDRARTLMLSCLSEHLAVADGVRVEDEAPRPQMATWHTEPEGPGAYVLEEELGAEPKVVNVDYPSSYYTESSALSDDTLYVWEDSPATPHPEVESTPVAEYDDAIWYGPVPTPPKQLR